MTRDPLEEFFARERAEVRELPGGPDHWQEIVRRARRPARRAWPAYLGLAAAAAAVLVVGYTALGPGRQQGDLAASTTSRSVTATVTQTVTAAPTESGGSSGKSSPATGATTQPTVLPVPVTFGALSLSNAGGGNLYSLGSARCASGPCVAVVASADDGRTWTTRSSFPDLTAPDGRRTPESGNQLLGVRFADPMVGYAYGSKAFRTTDGGRSWRPFDVGGQRVLSLETDGEHVWLVTAAQCRHGATLETRGCTDLQVWSAPTTAQAAALVRPLLLPRAAEAAWLAMDGPDAYVSVSFPDDTQALPQRVSGSAQALARPQGCATSGGVWVWGTANSRGALVAVCRAAAANAAYGIASSNDRGATWSPAFAAPALGRPGPAGVWLTAVDSSHLVAVTQALPTSGSSADPATAAWASADGGRHWVAPRLAQASDTWSWAGAAGGRLVYLLGGSPGSYAVSTDSGATFADRPFRR
jgi:hypothetical protein